MYLVYQHRRRDTGEIFYVGQGTPKRAYEDVRNRRNENWKRVAEEAGGFDVEILADGLDREESLRIEAEYIKKYGTIKHGTGILVNERLSGTRGSESGYKHSEDKIREIREKTRLAMQNPDVHARLVDSHIKYYEKDPRNRAKVRENLKKYVGDRHPRAKAVNQCTLDGAIIKTWSYARLATKELGYSASGICNCCKGKIESYAGYKWSYAE